jgi:hypothetical protein
MFNMGNIMTEFFSGRVTATSDAAGAFRLAGLAKGQYRLVVTAQGYAASVKKGVETGGEQLDIQLKPGARVSGRVAEAGGKPIVAARVKAGEIQGRSGEDGHFVLEGVAPNDPAANPFESMTPAAPRTENAAPATIVDIEASAPGYLQGEGKIDLASGRTEVDIELEKAPEISGTIFDPDGTPLPGSLVRLTPGVEMPGPFEVIDRGLIFLGVSLSDLEGKFRFSGFRTANKTDEYQVLADHPLYARGFSSKFKLAEKSGSTSGIDVRLARGCKVKGTVTDGAQPVPGATVRLSKKAPKQDAQAQQMNMFFGMLGLPKGGDVVYSSREGGFEYDRVLPGSYVVTAEALGFTDSSQMPVALEPGDEKEVSLVLNPGGEISGVVVDPAGSAIEGARVRLLRVPQGEDKNEKMILETQKLFGGSYKSTRSKDDGVFRIQGLPAGTYTLSVEHAGYSPREVQDISPGQGEQRIALLPAASLSGLVVDAANRQPITHFQVRVKLLGSEEAPKAGQEDFDISYLRSDREYHDIDGRFLRDDLDGGKYEVKVTSTGYSPSRAEIVLPPGGAVEQQFSLAQAGRIRGVVLDLATQAPISGAKVGLSKKGPRQEKDRGSEAENRSRRQRKEDRAGGNEKGDGAPKDEDARAMGEFFLDEWTGESTHSGEDGSFLLEGVLPEPQRVVASHASHITEWKEGVEAGPGQEVAITFLLRSGLTVSGKVSDSKGQAMEGRFLFLRGASEANAQVRKSTVSGKGGEFQIGGLEKGSYRLVITNSGDGTREPQSREIDLRESESGLDIRVDQN